MLKQAAATKQTAKSFSPKRMQVFDFRNPFPFFFFATSSHASQDEKFTISPRIRAAEFEVIIREI